MKELKNVPHISHMYYHFTEKNVHYLVMRFIDGKSLLDIQKENGGTLTINFLKQILPSALVTLEQMFIPYRCH